MDRNSLIKEGNWRLTTSMFYEREDMEAPVGAYDPWSSCPCCCLKCPHLLEPAGLLLVTPPPVWLCWHDSGRYQ